jgi:hypothetical protein
MRAGSSSGGGRTGRCGLRRRRRRAVVELLLGADEKVEHARAQVLAEDHRQRACDREQQQRAADPSAPARLLGGLAQRARRLAQRVRRIPDLALELAILEQGSRRRLAVAHAPVGIPRRPVGGEQARAQLLIFDQSLHVLVALRRPRCFSGLADPVFRCHRRHRLCREIAGQLLNIPGGHGLASTRARLLGVHRGLLLGRRERPRGPRAPLLAEDEPELLRRAQLRLVGTERGARLGQVERAEQVHPEVALLTAHLVHACGRAPSLLALRHRRPPDCELS